MIDGVIMKMISLRSVASSFPRNAPPIIARSPRNGIWRRDAVLDSRSRPPSTIVCPSRTITFVVISLVISSGIVTAAPVASVALRMTASEICGLSSIRIMPSLDTNGRKYNCVPVSRNSTVCVVDVWVAVVLR